MVHADDKGLVLPPLVAPQQVVLVPIAKKGLDREVMLAYVKKVETVLRQAGVRVKADTRDNYNPGWKYNHWELKGVPVRIEIGPDEIEAETVMMVKRMDGSKRVATLPSSVCACRRF